MSRHINDGIRETEQGLAGLRAVKERFPEAYFLWNRWVSHGVWQIATDVEFEARTEEGFGSRVRMWSYVEVGGVRVYDSGGTRDLLATIDWLKTKQPTAYARLVDAVARSAITPPETCTRVDELEASTSSPKKVEQ